MWQVFVTVFPLVLVFLWYCIKRQDSWVISQLTVAGLVQVFKYSCCKWTKTWCQCLVKYQTWYLNMSWVTHLRFSVDVWLFAENSIRDWSLISVQTSRNEESARSSFFVSSGGLTEVSLIPAGSCCHGCVSASELHAMIFPWTQIRTLGSEMWEGGRLPLSANLCIGLKESEQEVLNRGTKCCRVAVLPQFSTF